MLQRSAAVFGGGGVAGIAWEIGMVAGLARQGVHLAAFDILVGTSAGSVASTQVACGMSVEALLEQQRYLPEDSLEQFRPYSQASADAQNRKLMDKVHGDLTMARQRIGAFARRAVTPNLAERAAIIAARLPQAEWPDRDLRLVAVDAVSGIRRVFDRHGGVRLVDAVAASCAVPGTWPVVPVDGSEYMDGGIESMTNAWAADGASRVVVLAPLGWSDDNPVSGHLRREVADLESAGARVQVLLPDEASRAALGDNVLDPARRPACAREGLRQGMELAASLCPWRAG